MKRKFKIALGVFLLVAGIFLIAYFAKPLAITPRYENNFISASISGENYDSITYTIYLRTFQDAESNIISGNSAFNDGFAYSFDIDTSSSPANMNAYPIWKDELVDGGKAIFARANFDIGTTIGIQTGVQRDGIVSVNQTYFDCTIRNIGVAGYSDDENPFKAQIICSIRGVIKVSELDGSVPKANVIISGMSNPTITVTFPKKQIVMGYYRLSNNVCSAVQLSSEQVTSNDFRTLADCSSHVINACNYFDYSEWSACSNGVKTRQIVSSLPIGCTGGNPVLSDDCSVGNTTSKSFYFLIPIAVLVVIIVALVFYIRNRGKSGFS